MLFFFFQAEDGIRDLTVTGVQTCALPISWREHSQGSPQGDRLLRLQGGGGDGDDQPAARLRHDRVDRVRPRGPGGAGGGRSGERRVGEEGRARGAADHLKKKKSNERWIQV